MHDLLIRRATVVDGTGAEPVSADVAVKDGRITDVSRVTGNAQRTITADRAHLLPGFIDIHTHYDGQISWDETFTPSIYHGVTTLVMGNCGVGFTPVRPGQQAPLIDLMQGVEDISESVLSEGIRWGWETFGEYARAMDSMPHSLGLHDAGATRRSALVRDRRARCARRNGQRRRPAPDASAVA
ncbi:MAG: N-acyl-D-aspartate/D-glutamate deacylase [Gammaproteobacteria bacterium]|jgi:N-acyl-D-aspartate/D-glutamate deacylase